MVAKAKKEEDKSTEKLIFILKIPSIQAYIDKEKIKNNVALTWC